MKNCTLAVSRIRHTEKCKEKEEERRVEGAELSILMGHWFWGLTSLKWFPLLMRQKGVSSITIWLLIIIITKFLVFYVPGIFQAWLGICITLKGRYSSPFYKRENRGQNGIKLVSNHRQMVELKFTTSLRSRAQLLGTHTPRQHLLHLPGQTISPPGLQINNPPSLAPKHSI